MNRWAPHPISLRQLQYALAVAEYHSFRKAAEACSVAQPSLSAQLAQLESVLGVRIFERLPRKIVVTPSGAAILERARRTVLEADDLIAAAVRAENPLSVSLHIGVIPTVAPYLLPELAPVLRAQDSRFHIRWDEDRTASLIDRIESGELDAAVLATESHRGDLRIEPIGKDSFFLAVPPGHRLAGSAASTRLEQLDGETVLLLSDGHCFRDQALEICRRSGADEASVRATSLSTLAQMVAGGMGITLLPQISLRTENRARGLVTRSFGPRGPSRTLGLAWRKTSPSEKSLRALVETMGAVLARMSAQAPP